MQSSPNNLSHRVDIAQHLIVPKPQDKESRLLQALVTPLVSLIVQMLPTIHFDNQALFQAGEIQYVVQERMLATEFAARHLATSQTLPQMDFGIGHVVPQLALDMVVDD